MIMTMIIAMGSEDNHDDGHVNGSEPLWVQLLPPSTASSVSACQLRAFAGLLAELPEPPRPPKKRGQTWADSCLGKCISICMSCICIMFVFIVMDMYHNIISYYIYLLLSQSKVCLICIQYTICMGLYIRLSCFAIHRGYKQGYTRVGGDKSCGFTAISTK